MKVTIILDAIKSFTKIPGFPFSRWSISKIAAVQAILETP